MAPNISAMYELHFGVPMAGAVLCALNTRLDPPLVSKILGHSKVKIFFVDYQFVPIAEKAIKILSKNNIMNNLPLLVLIPECGQPISPTFSNSLPNSWNFECERLLSTGKLDFEIVRPTDKWDPIALNYTLGTTSGPKSVIYTHGGTYLNYLAGVLLNETVSMHVYLWWLPIFHTNGWGLPWTIVAQGGTNVCQRNVTAKGIVDFISRHNVTHISGAPTITNMIISASKRGQLQKLPLANKFGFCVNKTSTGKVQKYLIKDKAKAMGSLSKDITICNL